MFHRLELRPAAASPGKNRTGSGIAARTLLRELESLSGVHLEMMVRNSGRFHSAELIQLLLERSHSLRYADPPQMLRWARLAVEIAGRLTSEDTAEEERLRDLCAASYSQLSHALRVSGDLAAAERALASAQASLHRGTGGLMVRAVVSECLGSLRMAQIRSREAILPYAAAVEIYRHLGRADLVGRALVGQAIAVGESREPEEALELLFEALPKIEGDPRTTLAACHTMIRLLIDTGRIDQAACRWIDLRTLYDKLKDPILKIRAAWLEGLLLRAESRYPAALKLLKTAFAGFHEHGLSYQAALVSLDMAECYFRLGDSQKLRQSLSEVMTLARDHDVDRQALLTLILLQQAAGCEADLPPA
jgi:tetratricopeptide (TPR) repeat protein